MKSIRYLLICLIVVGVMVAGIGVAGVSAEADCVIPESGPWPPCATGGNSQPAHPPANSTGTSECVIPESGPWPACASGGGAAPQQQIRRYSQWELRTIFMDIFNKDFGMAEGEHGYINKWQPNTTITLENGIMRMTSHHRLPNGDVIYHDYGASFSAASGEPLVDTRWLEIGSRQIGGEDLKLIEDFIELFFRVHVYNELHYSEVTAVYLDGTELVVTYR